MVGALTDADSAWQQYLANPKLDIESGNTRTNLMHWLASLGTLGKVDRTVASNCLTAVVFLKGPERSYVVFNPRNRPLKVSFSDGREHVAPSKGIHVFTVNQ